MNVNATILGQAIAFILFVLFCMKYIWPLIIASIEKRQKEISDSLFAAEQTKKKSDLAKANAIEQLKKARIEAKTIIEQANKQRVKMIEKAKTEAKTEHNKIVAQAKIEINSDHRRAYEEFRKQAAMLAILGAEKIIERSIDLTTNNDIVDKFINEL